MSDLQRLIQQVDDLAEDRIARNAIIAERHAQVAALRQALADLTDAAESIGDHPVPRGLLVALREAAAAARRTLEGD